ncbi:probable histone-arginine methyltransferase 1.3 [Telopea speciosissima]|uniref:probable histone-arginine methyltransferase 1.3 n=1 Tax=Telopea speciosissima TaxID=54955 RepID=UPI001CC5D4CB|nr:probable histone-arginine methyltransferase 1.3 [Telopea speciosissima]
MEASLGQKQKQQEFSVSVSQLSASSSAAAVARFSIEPEGAQLRFHTELEPSSVIQVDIRTAQLFKLGPIESVCINEGSSTNEEEISYSRGITIQFKVEDESRAFHRAFEHWKKESVQVCAGGRLENGEVLTSKSKFDDKIAASSAKMYFHYYGQLLHQQNMLQDYVRTGTYYAAVIENRADFIGRVVVDVGAGSGILSLFAAQAGAKHVYAVEASEMAEYARRLIAGNPSLGQRITVIRGKVEEVEVPEKADILISEPMGTLLINERMLESYVIARDRFLLPNGKMFPTIGRLVWPLQCNLVSLLSSSVYIYFPEIIFFELSHEFEGLQVDFSVGLKDFFIRKVDNEDLQMFVQDMLPLLLHLRLAYNALLELQVENQSLKLPVLNFIVKLSRLGSLIDSKSDLAITKVVQKLGFSEGP